MLDRTAGFGHKRSFVSIFSTRFNLIKFGMQAELRSLISPALPSGPSDAPENPHYCWVVMQATIGHGSGDGADVFTFYVTTPAFLERILDDKGYELGRGLVVINQFDWKVVEELIKRTCANARGDSWETFVQQLSRNFLSEYEDYQS